MISKLPQYTMYVLMIVSVLVTILAFSDTYDPIIYSMYVFFIISIILAFMLTAVGMIMNPKGIKATLFTLVGFAVLFGISYLLSSDEVIKGYAPGTTASDSKLIGMSIIAMYILFLGSIGSVIYSAVARMFK